ncbi:arylamine N-acetyltransferase family protein [Adlercreutzia faecimuris]|uniref:Arylamine N-acetyltransferase n=1 Tax=Adlercreutzia faecimuris TaxID=2897341 RepID=A0ABS9WE36_9ACTN|nr:arylamine N-acetyltransferase [Adlercreutzia sp. JBNU-10]MCI2241135.1 arylamine N-acetyltransferase [Adlercreutzia sp. JBNU-10]
MLTGSQITDYLARIGVEGRPAPTAANLAMLMERHLTSVPFETVGLCRAGRAPDLRLSALFDKMVRRRRGGYCFELNKLFEALLMALGYDARPCLSRSADVPGQRDPINHRGLLVALDGDLLLADVGYGGPAPAAPLRLAPVGPQLAAGAWFEAVPLDACWWRVDRFRPDAAGEEPGERLGVLELCVARVEDADFEALSLACSQPGTEFRDQEMANLRTASGHVSLTGDRLVIREGATRRQLDLADADRAAALRDFFGLVYD